MKSRKSNQEKKGIYYYDLTNPLDYYSDLANSSASTASSLQN